MLVEAAPPAAPRVFGSAFERARQFAELLTGPGLRRGLIGPREPAWVWSRHLLNCAALEPLLGTAHRVVDVGSGAGLPGVVLALMRPNTHFTLVEPMLRRCAFLEEVIGDLGLVNVDVRRGRVETVGADLRADVVVARAVAALAPLVSVTLPMLRGGAELLAIKGASAAAEVATAASVLRRHDARAQIIVIAGVTGVPATTVVRVAAGKPSRN